MRTNTPGAAAYLRKDVRARRASIILLIAVGLAVFSDFLANERPIACLTEAGWQFPVIRQLCHEAGLCKKLALAPEAGWMETEYRFVLWAPVPYSPGSLDIDNANTRGPFDHQEVKGWRFRHWLGTDALGRDVTAIMIHGCRKAMVIGLMSMFIAIMVGVPLGAVAGYFGNSRWRTGAGRIALIVILTLALAWFLLRLAGLGGESSSGIAAWSLVYAVMCAAGIALLMIGSRSVGSNRGLLKSRPVAVDGCIMRAVELARSVPSLFLVFALLALVPDPGLEHVVLIIGALRIPTIIRYVRAESLKLGKQNFIVAARMIGLSDVKVIWRHIIPNSLGPVAVHVAFGIGGAILIESALSFLGVGLGIDEMTWGRLLSGARSDFSAWWLAVFPGAAIFVTVAAFNRIGDSLSGFYEGR